jgi:ectoine hydroxylase-related dioxygenase (phytanoyl-CoA dioxygenase family)
MDATAFFHTAGYLRVAGLLGSDEIERLRLAAMRIEANSNDPRVRHTPEKTRLDHAVSVDTAYLDVATSGPVLETLTPVLGPNIELIENRHNHLSLYRAPANDRLHRDILQWSRSILTVLLYLSDCTDLDSATRVVPGSHLWPCAGKPNNGGTWLDQTPYADLANQAVSLPARPGDALLMHGQLYHAGGGVSLTGPRVVLTLAYRSIDELAPEPPTHCRLVQGQRIHRGRGEIRV